MAIGDGVIWNEAAPDNSTLAHQIDDYDRDLRLGVRSRMAREHVWPASQTGTGEGGHHQFITFQQQTAAPTLLASSGMVGCLYVGSSGSGYPLIFENSAGSTVTLVASAAGAIAVVNTGTLGSIPICSSANPNTLITLTGPTSTTASTWLLASVNAATGGTAAPTWVLPSTAMSGVSVIGATNMSAVLGAWEDKSANYGAQQAATDGFVCAGFSNVAQSCVAQLLGYTDALSNPVTLRGTAEASSWENSEVTKYTSFMMPVKKGDYWKVVLSVGYGSDTTTKFFFWIPLGS